MGRLRSLSGSCRSALRQLFKPSRNILIVARKQEKQNLIRFSRIGSVIRPVDPRPLVSLIVPTRDQADLLGVCLDGLLNHTDYPAVELSIVDHASEHPETFKLLTS